MRTFSACARKRAVASSRNEPLVHGRLKLEIEIVERLHRREVRDLEAHGDARALLRVDLLAKQAVEKVEIRRLGARGIIEHGVEALGDVAQPEARQLLDDASMHDRAHWPPPAMSVAYVVRSRPSAASAPVSGGGSGAGRQRPA